MLARSRDVSVSVAQADDPENANNALDAKIVERRIFEVERITVRLQSPKGNAGTAEVGWVQHALHV